MSIGEELAEARRRANLTVTQVSQRTCIRKAIIREIEQDDYTECGGDFYVRGHIRSIARAVGTDPAPLIQRYDAAKPPPPPGRPAELFGPVLPIEPPRRHRAPWVAAAVLVLLALAAGAYYLRGVVRHTPPAAARAAARSSQAAHGHAATSTHPATASTQPAAAASAQASPAALAYAHRIVIRLVAVEDCWVGFSTPSGDYLSQAYITAGGTRDWTFHHGVNIRIGNPGGIHFTVDGKHPLHEGMAGPVTLQLRLHGHVTLSPS